MCTEPWKRIKGSVTGLKQTKAPERAYRSPNSVFSGGISLQDLKMKDELYLIFTVRDPVKLLEKGDFII